LGRSDEILARASHRPWPAPTRPWALAMTWRDLLFAHWPVDPDALRPSLPEGLELDTRDGAAWLGVVPFRMEGVRHRLAPPVPGLSAFPELNLRTYVTVGGKPGVYFYSLDATSRPAIETARALFGLNYLKARMSCRRAGDEVIYESERTDRRGPPAGLRCRYRAEGEPFHADPGSLEAFLTERYCLYAVRAGRLLRGEIHHAPWPLRGASWEYETCDMSRLAGVELEGPPASVLMAARLAVVAWTARRASEQR